MQQSCDQIKKKKKKHYFIMKDTYYNYTKELETSSAL